LAARATVPTHYRSLIDKTFEVIKSEIKVWKGDTETTLKVGQSATITKGTLFRSILN